MAQGSNPDAVDRRDSVWLHSAPTFADPVPSDADVIIVGAGFLGLLTAYHLVEAGYRVAVIEARRIGTGTSGHTTGKITCQHGIIYTHLIKSFGERKAREYAQTNLQVIDEYEAIIEKERIECDFVREPARIFTQDEDEFVTLVAEQEAAQSVGIPSRIVESFLGKALEFPDQARLQPYEFLIGLAQALRRKGVSITEMQRVVRYDEQEAQCTVTTEDGVTYTATQVVLATLAPINEKAFYALRLKPVAHHGLAFDAQGAKLDAMYLQLESPTISFRQYGNSILAIGSDTRLGEQEDPYVTLEAQARKHLALGRVTHHWSAHDLQTMDKVPFVGSLTPTSKRIFTATGFRAWGLTQSMVTAKMIAQEIAGQHDKDSIYTTWRVKGDFGKFVSQTAHAVKQLATPGKRCTHMGCALKWNEHDATYDCSCHGSRFDAQGRVISGPATKDLE